MKKPLVTVVTPCYNQAVYLPEALNSVLGQSYENWECIIVNDGSPDNTEEIAVSYCNKDERFKYHSKENGGLASARNAGIKIGRGEYVLPLDADDMIEPRYLEKAIDAFLSDPSITLVYCEARKFGYENGLWKLKEYSYRDLLLANMIFCSAIFKRKDWATAGGYNENFKNGGEDWAFWIKLLDDNSGVYKIPEVLFSYRTKPTSMIKEMTSADRDEVRWFVFEHRLSSYKKYFASPITIYFDNIDLKKRIFYIQNSKAYKLWSFLRKLISFRKRSTKRSHE